MDLFSLPNNGVGFSLQITFFFFLKQTKKKKHPFLILYSVCKLFSCTLAIHSWKVKQKIVLMAQSVNINFQFVSESTSTLRILWASICHKVKFVDQVEVGPPFYFHFGLLTLINILLNTRQKSFQTLLTMKCYSCKGFSESRCYSSFKLFKIVLTLNLIKYHNDDTFFFLFFFNF